MSITYEQASEAVVKYLLGRFKGMENDPPLITQAWVYPWGWLFLYNSKSFLEGRDELAYYIGNLPLFFNKIDGTIEFVGSILKTNEESMEEYRIDKGYAPLPDDFELAVLTAFQKKL